MPTPNEAKTFMGSSTDEITEKVKVDPETDEIIRYLTGRDHKVRDPELDVTFIPFITPRLMRVKEWFNQSHQIYPDIEISRYGRELSPQSIGGNRVQPLTRLSRDISNPFRALRLAVAALVHL